MERMNSGFQAVGHQGGKGVWGGVEHENPHGNAVFSQLDAFFCASDSHEGNPMKLEHTGDGRSICAVTGCFDDGQQFRSARRMDTNETPKASEVVSEGFQIEHQPRGVTLLSQRIHEPFEFFRPRAFDQDMRSFKSFASFFNSVKCGFRVRKVPPAG